jgi:hypothetical protein
MGRKWQHKVRQVVGVLGAPFIGWEMERSGWEAGGPVAVGEVSFNSDGFRS